MSPDTGDYDARMKDKPFLSLLSALFWVSRCCRYDIAVALTILSRASANPDLSHWNALLRVLKYLANTITHGIVIRPSADFYNPTILAYTDASYASDPATGRSVSGQFITVDNTILDWTSKHQPYVTLSSGDAETVAATAAATQVEYWKQLMELPCGNPPTAYIATDSTTAQQILTNPIHTTVMKHVRTRQFYVRELVNAGRFSFFHTPGKDNPSDMLTKPLDGPTIRHLKRPLRSWGGDAAHDQAERQATGTNTPLNPGCSKFRCPSGPVPSVRPARKINLWWHPQDP